MGSKYGTRVTSICGNEYCYQDPCGDYILLRVSVSHAILAKNTYISLTYICTAGRWIHIYNLPLSLRLVLHVR